jgi:hypothetical protein
MPSPPPTYEAATAIKGSPPTPSVAPSSESGPSLISHADLHSRNPTLANKPLPSHTFCDCLFPSKNAIRKLNKGDHGDFGQMCTQLADVVQETIPDPLGSLSCRSCTVHDSLVTVNRKRRDLHQSMLNKAPSTSKQTKVLQSNLGNIDSLGKSSYVPVPSDPTRPSDPDQSLFALLKERHSALSKAKQPWYTKLGSIFSPRVKRRVEGLDELAAEYGAMTHLILSPDSLATDQAHLRYLRQFINCIDQTRRSFVTGTKVHSDVRAAIKQFDVCRALAHRTVVEKLLPKEDRDKGTTVCLDKARVFCMADIGGMCAIALCHAALMYTQSPVQV